MLAVSATAAAMLVAAVGMAAPALAAPNTGIPLLLIHGFNDDCHAAWNQVGLNQNGTAIAGSTSTVSYLTSQVGYSPGEIKEIGYYTKREQQH